MNKAILTVILILGGYITAQAQFSQVRGRIQPLPLHLNEKDQPDLYLGVVYQNKMNQRVAVNDYFYIFLIYDENFRGELEPGNQLSIELVGGETVFLYCDDYTPPPIAAPSTGGFFRVEQEHLEKLISSKMAAMSIETTDGLVQHPIELNNNVFVDYFRR